MASSLGGYRFLGLGALPLECRKTLFGFYRIGAYIGRVIVVVIIGALCLSGCRHFGSRRHMLDGVEIADHDIDQFALFLGDQIIVVS